MSSLSVVLLLEIRFYCAMPLQKVVKSAHLWSLCTLRKPKWL